MEAVAKKTPFILCSSSLVAALSYPFFLHIHLFCCCFEECGQLAILLNQGGAELQLILENYCLISCVTRTAKIFSADLKHTSYFYLSGLGKAESKSNITGCRLHNGLEWAVRRMDQEDRIVTPLQAFKTEKNWGWPVIRTSQPWKEIATFFDKAWF